MYLADFASSYITKKSDDLTKEPDEIKNYTVPVSNVNAVKLHPNIIVLKSELGEMQKRSLPYELFLQSVQIEKPRRALLETFAVVYALKK